MDRAAHLETILLKRLRDMAARFSVIGDDLLHAGLDLLDEAIGAVTAAS